MCSINNGPCFYRGFLCLYNPFAKSFIFFLLISCDVCTVISRKLIQALNQPWLIEPEAAQKWMLIALDLLQPQAVATPVSYNAPKECVPYTKNGVMVLPVNGPLMKYTECGVPGTSNMLVSLNEALADPNVEAIVLQIDSPGGTVDGTKVFADAIKASTKPVVAFVDGLMASAAMWIGSSASEIVASTNHDIVGSIGTMMQWMDFTEAYKAKGIKIHSATATESSDKNKMFSDATATGNYTELITTMLDPVNNDFLGAMKNNRAGKIDLSKENVLTGKIYMAKEAIKYGLVDKIGTLDMAIKRAKTLAAAKQKSMETVKTSFQKTLTAAGATEFALVDNVGFAMTEENLNSVEAVLTANEQSITAITQERDTAVASLNTITGERDTAVNSLATATTEIATLNARIVALGGKPAPVATPALQQEVKKVEYTQTSVDKEKAKRKAEMA